MKKGTRIVTSKTCCDCFVEKPIEYFLAKDGIGKLAARKFCENCRDVRNMKRYKKTILGRLAYLKRTECERVRNQSELVCKYCGLTKPITEFAGFYSTCRICNRNAQRQRRIDRGFSTKPSNNIIQDSSGRLSKACNQCGIVWPLEYFGDRRRQCPYCSYSLKSKRGEFQKAINKGIIDKEEIIRRDNSTCYLCRKILRRDEVTFDHVIPVSKGGTQTMENLKVACKPCNSRKHNKLLSELIGIFTYSSE